MSDLLATLKGIRYYEVQRAGALIACFLGGLASGTMYLYSAYAPQLASHLALKAVHTSFIGMVGNLGMALSGPIAGYLVDQHGISMPLAIGSLFVFLGYTTVRTCYVSVISSVPLLCIALLFVGSGSSFVFSAIVKCAALNYPDNRGFATSVPLAAFGLSALFMSTVYKVFPLHNVADEQEKLLTVLAMLPACMYIFVYLFAKVHYDARYRQPDIPMMSIARSTPEIGAFSGGTDELASRRLEDLNTDINPMTLSKDVHGTQLLRRRLFWLQFSVMGVSSGIGQMYIYSCGYIVKGLVVADKLKGSLDGQADISTALSQDMSAEIAKYQGMQVGLISMMSFVGRLASGSLSDYVYKQKNLQRSWILIMSSSIFILAQVFGRITVDVQHLWIVSCLTGYAYGSTFGSYPTIISDYFGMRHFSQNWGLLALSPIPVSYLFNMLFGKVYDTRTTEYTLNDGSKVHECVLGSKCYSTLFDITFCTSIVAQLLVFQIIRTYDNFGRNKKEEKLKTVDMSEQELY